MAPRKKRTTAKKGRTTRAKPKLPEGKLDCSMTCEEKENKVKDYINDYVIQVKAKIDKMRKSAATVTSLVANVYRNALIQIPKNVKQMTMEEFLSKGGTVNAVMNAQVTECIQELVPAVNCSNYRPPLTNMSNTGNTTDSTSHIEETSVVQADSTVKRKPSRKRKVQITEETPALFPKPPMATGTRSSRRLQAKSQPDVTPMTGVSKSAVQMPFITPKFDPRLPITPAILREPKAGERIVSMCGSPLTNPAGPTASSKAAQVIIPIKGGKTILFSSNDKPTTINELDVINDNIALKNIKLLQDKLSMLLNMPKNQ